MKRVLFIIILMAAMWQVQAQRPVIMAGSPGYLFTPPPTQENVIIQSTIQYNFPLNAGTPFHGNAYRPSHGAWVYGVAVTLEDDMANVPYVWVYLLQDRRVDSVNYCYAIDTVVAELFCFIDQPPVSYADFGFVASNGDTTICQFYEFYFSEPVNVPAGVRFYVGISHSPYNVYNHVNKDTIYWPYVRWYGPSFVCYDGEASLDHDCQGDGLDSTWSLNKGYYPDLVDWACGTCNTHFSDPTMENAAGRYKYRAHGFFPIIRSPEDSRLILRPHDHPLRAEAVPNFRLRDLDSTHASFVWDTPSPSEWGPLGVNVDVYQVNYAPYMQEYDEEDTLLTADIGCTLYMTLDSTVMYKARCRARSRHICDIHDTVVWGEWSNEVYFHTGVGVPDTVPLVCPRVEGLRYEGLVGGNPKISWDSCEGHDFYDVQYAPVGGAWQRAPTTSLTTCVLYASWVPGTRYMVRVRAKCNHQCFIHDTVMVSEWSETMEFVMPGEGVETVDETEGRGMFALAPNPAKGNVTVKPMIGGDEYPAMLTVSDVKGREMLRKELSHETHEYTFHVSDFPAGTYFVTLSTPDGTSTQRLVVEGR